jgi:hypothetical protein
LTGQEAQVAFVFCGKKYRINRFQELEIDPMLPEMTAGVLSLQGKK